jgi:hypothetical protein
MSIVLRLSPQLPEEYVAEPRVHLGTNFEIDVCAFEPNYPRELHHGGLADNGDVATALWAPPEPTLVADVDASEQYAYEVLIFDQARARLLVAAVELVSPGNKDRSKSRRAFVTKCAALIGQGVSVSIVDLVTTRQFNLYAEVLEQIGVSDPALGEPPPATYAATCRGRKVNDKPRFETWAYPLVVGQALPTLPIWLNDYLAISLDLEASYEDTCRALRIP